MPQKTWASNTQSIFPAPPANARGGLPGARPLLDQLRDKRRACSRFARGFDAADVGLHDGSGDGETEADVAVGASFVGTVKALEDVPQVFGWNAGPAVAYG